MSYVYLYAKDGSEYGDKATVDLHDYHFCNLFIKYEHKAKRKLKPGNIWLYKTNSLLDYVTIRANSDHESQVLSSEMVYFNRYENKTPLITVLNFGSQAESKYYTNSEYEQDCRRWTRRNISGLEKYDKDRGDEQILQKLLDENDKLPKTLTFQIEKTNEEEGSDKISYNDGKIELYPKEDVKGPRVDNSHGFYKYKHEPQHKNRKYNSYFLYNKSLLKTKDSEGLQILEKVQNQKHNVTVYYGKRVLEPLMLEFNTGGSQYDKNNIYYHPKREGKELFFEKFDMKQYDLTKENNKLLIQHLQGIESELVVRILIPIETKSEYTKEQIQTLTGHSPGDAQPGSIEVTDKTGECEQLKGLDYKCFEHSITVLTENQDKSFKIVPFVNKTEITVLKGINSTDYDKEYIYYNKSSVKLLVYFYGKEDPRPLLFCYNSSTFKPKSLNDYKSKWVKVEEIKSCKCSQYADIRKRKLKEICDYLNTVNIYRSSKYQAHEQYSPEIEIGVDKKDLTCYYKYTHTAKSGHKLGKVVYKKDMIEHNVAISESSENDIDKVNVYYYRHDQNRQYPLLLDIELKSMSVNNVYYKLISDTDYRFQKIEGSINGDNELLDQLFALNKQFNGENSSNPDGVGCKDTGNSKAQLTTGDSSNERDMTIAVSVTASIAFVSGGILIYKYRDKISNCFTQSMKEV